MVTTMSDEYEFTVMVEGIDLDADDASAISSKLDDAVAEALIAETDHESLDGLRTNVGAPQIGNTLTGSMSVVASADPTSDE
jgi:hypothetical protein